MTKFKFEITVEACKSQVKESEIREHIENSLRDHPHSVTHYFESVKIKAKRERAGK